MVEFLLSIIAGAILSTGGACWSIYFLYREELRRRR